MTVSTFVQPNYNTQQGTTYPLGLDAAIAAMARPAAGFAAHEQATPNMTVRVDAGALYIGQTLTEVAAQSTATITAPATNPRKDIVHIDLSTGAVGVATGAEAASPTDPAIPAGKWPVARITLATSTTAIANSILDDLRPPGGPGLPTVTQAEAEAGTGTAPREWTPERVKQAIAAIASGEDAWARVNLLVNWLDDKIGHTVATGEMMDGVSDAFATDTVGVTSDGETYEATGKYYTTGQQTQIAQGTGTAIGDMTVNGGLAAAFDGTTSQVANSCAAKSATIGYVGKDWGVGVTKTITGFKAWGSSDAGFETPDNTNSITITLLGNSTNDTGTATSLGSVSGTDSAGLLLTKLSGLTTTTAYRYHWLKFDTAAGGNVHCAEAQFFETVISNITLMPAPTTAQAQPTDARLVILHDPVDAVTINTDVKVYKSRDDGRAVTADAGTDKLALTAHGLANGDRVFLSNSGGALPGGSAANRLYHVVGATANDFQVSLTSGGAAIDITSAGTGTHKVHKAIQVTLTNEGAWDANYNILSGTVNISGLPAGTRMMWIVETLNNKEQRVRGVAQMWS